MVGLRWAARQALTGIKSTALWALHTYVSSQGDRSGSRKGFGGDKERPVNKDPS